MRYVGGIAITSFYSEEKEKLLYRLLENLYCPEISLAISVTLVGYPATSVAKMEWLVDEVNAVEKHKATVASYQRTAAIALEDYNPSWICHCPEDTLFNQNVLLNIDRLFYRYPKIGYISPFVVVPKSKKVKGRMPDMHALESSMISMREDGMITEGCMHPGRAFVTRVVPSVFMELVFDPKIPAYEEVHAAMVYLQRGYEVVQCPYISVTHSNDCLTETKDAKAAAKMLTSKFDTAVTLADDGQPQFNLRNPVFKRMSRLRTAEDVD